VLIATADLAIERVGCRSQAPYPLDVLSLAKGSRCKAVGYEGSSRYR
jgi:hypothetical protein